MWQSFRLTEEIFHTILEGLYQNIDADLVHKEEVFFFKCWSRKTIRDGNFVWSNGEFCQSNLNVLAGLKRID